MLSFLGGGNPFARDPMQSLTEMAQDPASTGSVPPAASVAPAGGQAVAPSPSPDQGGGGFSASGIGNTLGDMFSGKGLFGGSASDTEIDPMTGAPRGMQRQANMQSMMKMGLLFLAAGQNMSSDSRAAILAKAPSLVGGGNDDINSFAKSRLEMAKLRLEQQKQLNEKAAMDSQTETLRSLAGGGPAPSAGAGAVQQAQAGNAETAAALGAPGAAPAAGGAPAAPMPAPGATMGAPAAPLPTGPALAPGGVPRGPLLSPADVAGITANPTVAGRGQAISQVLTANQNREVQGQPTFNSQTGKFETPIFNGRGEKIRTQVGDTPAVTTRDIEGERHSGYVKPDGTFHTISKSAIPEDPAAVEQRKANLQLAQGDRDKLQTNYTDAVQRSVQSYDKMRGIREQVRDGKGVFGTGSDLLRSTMNALATAGYLDKEKTGDLNVSSNFERVMKNGVAGVIKDFNGSQGVSNTDREFALQVMGAAATNNRDAVINALNNGMTDVKDIVGRHNENVDRHNGLLNDFSGSTKQRLTVPRVDRNFSTEETEIEKKRAERAQQGATGGSAGGTPPAGGNAGAGVVRWEMGPDGKPRKVRAP